MANATAQQGARGAKAAAEKALAAIELQDKLPNARVVYVSATGATEVGNLAYAKRLGLWGEGTEFPNRTAFMRDIQQGGMAAMELIARDMKALGSYIARNLSYDGVDYDRVEHVLTPEQRGLYDKMAEGWQVVLQHFNAALQATSGSVVAGNRRSAILSQFWGGHQRFFNQIITALQMPTVLRGVEKDLAEGRQAVLQLVNTNEASQERAIAERRASDAEGDLEDLDMTPRKQLLTMVENAYPIHQFEDYVEPGSDTVKSRPVLDSEGKPVINPEMVKARDKLLGELGSLRVPDGPLEMLINHFGTDQVAEVTGRKQRVVRKLDSDGKMKMMEEKRGGAANVAEAADFQAGKKRILVFSEAGGTGRSYHAAIGSGSEDARRSHYLVQAGWRADKAVQGFGRTHRTNQASAPIFHLVTTDLQGQKRFISSIARRLGQLGALTKGERRTGDQGLFNMRDNLESTEATAALRQFFRDVHRGNVEGLSMDDLERGMGLKLTDPRTGGLRGDLPEMSQFLNRVLSLTIDRQNLTFDAFAERLDAVIERAASSGTLDTGVETYRADKIAKASEQTVYTEPRTGAETKHVHLEVYNRNRPVSFEDTVAGRNKTGGVRPTQFVRNTRSGNIFAVTPARDYTDADGNVISQVRLTSPTDYQYLDRDKLTGTAARPSTWQILSSTDAKPLWDTQFANTPEFHKGDLHLITGAILPIWTRLGGDPKIYRLQTEAGERMLGRVVPNSIVADTLKRLGVSVAGRTVSPAELIQHIMVGGDTAHLANGWRIKPSRVAGEMRMEIIGPDYRNNDELARYGVFVEQIAYQTRYFIPTGKDASAAIRGITASRPLERVGDTEAGLTPPETGAGGTQFSPRRVPLPPQAGTDMFGTTRPEAEPRPERAPTIRGDRRQTDMFGRADAAVQAQAARDQAGRGALAPKGEQRPADEGLFAPKTPQGGTLFSPREPGEEPLGYLRRAMANYDYAAMRREHDAWRSSPEMVAKQRDLDGRRQLWMAANAERDQANWYRGRAAEPETTMEGRLKLLDRAERRDARYEAAAGVARAAGVDPDQPFPRTPDDMQFRSRTLFSPRDDDRTPLYSALQRGVEGLKLDRAAPGQWLSTIRNMAGVKPEELKWSGVEDWLKAQPRPVTRADVQDYLRANALDVREVMRGEPRAAIEWTERTLPDGTVRYQAEAAADPAVPGSRAGSAIIERNPDGTVFGKLPGTSFRRHDSVEAAKEWLENDVGVRAERPTKFGQWQVPGGENYREMLITLPDRDTGALDQEVRSLSQWPDRPEIARRPEDQARLNGLLRQWDMAQVPYYKSPHWEEPNVLAHTRFNDRTAPDGKRTLLVEEVQSDWHQAGRKQGYQGGPSFDVTDGGGFLRGNFTTREEAEAHLASLNDAARQGARIEPATGKHGVPDAPFKTSWPALVMKRIIKYAVDHGYDRVAWPPGDVQVDRYDLSKHVGTVAYAVEGRQKGTLQVMDRSGKLLSNPTIGRDEELADHIGKEAADKLLSSPTKVLDDQYGKWHVLSGLDLKVGGEGMRAFYDKMLPAEVNKIAGKFGGKVGTSEVPTTVRTQVHGEPGAQTIAVQRDTQPVHSLDITPAMREGVQAQGLPLFSPRITGADRETEAYTPEQTRAYTNVGRVTDEPGLRARMATAREDAGRRILRYTLDPYIGVKRDDPAGYMALRNANTTAGASLMFLTDGTLKFAGSTYAMADRNGGVENHLVRPLQGEQDRFLWWVAAHRAGRLSEEDRENLWSPEDIATIKETNRGQTGFDYTLPNGAVTRSREAIYADSLRKLDTFNRNVMDLAVESGLLDRNKISAMLANPFYVPFYRQAEDEGQFVGPRVSPAFVKQYAFKQLTGGTQKLNHDLWQNAIGNWSHMIDASLRNRAAAGVLDTAVTNGAAREVSAQEYEHQMTKAEKQSAAWVMKNGERQYYSIGDRMLYTAITALNFNGFNNPIMRAVGAFKKWLTIGVTSNPLFMLRVSIRDAEQALATSPSSYNVLGNIAKGFRMGDLPGALQNVARAVAGREMQPHRLSNLAADVIAGGGTMHLGSGLDTGVRKTDLATMLDNPTAIGAFWKRIGTIATAYHQLTALGEDVHRFALYDKLIAEGMPHDAAAFAARDLEDFTLRGAGTIVRGLTQMVPFMNAWAQGLYKVGRSAVDADRNITTAVGMRVASSATRRVMVVLGATALLTLALDAIYKDDEDYKKRTDADRNANFWFKFGGVQFRIPMGFEIAALARTAANGVEAFFDKEMTARRFFNNMEQVFVSNLSMNPTPQIIKPILDVAMNRTDTGTPIVPKGMETLRPEYQYNANTTLLSRAISSVGSSAARAVAGPQARFLAPVQLDYLTNAYFGWLGSMIAGTADRAAREFAPASVAPARPAMDLWNFATGGMVSTQPQGQSRYVDLLYQQGDAINAAFDTYHKLLTTGRVGEAREFFAENKGLIAKHALVSQLERFEAQQSQMATRVENNPNLSAEQKRVAMMKINAARNRVAEQAFGGARTP